MEKTLKEQAIIVEQRLWYHFAGPTGELNAPAGLPFMKEFLAEVDRLVALAKRSDENSGLHKHVVNHPVCHLCRDTGWYFIPNFAGGGQTVRCGCGK